MDDARGDAVRGYRAGALSQRERADQLAGRELRQVFALLRLRADQPQELGREINGRREGHGCQRTSQLLGDHAELEITGPEPAVVLGDGGAAKPQRRKLPPPPPIKRHLAIENAPHHGGRALVRQHAPRLVAELFLVGGKIQVHRVLGR